MAGGLEEDDSFAVAAALKRQCGVKKAEDLALVDDEDIAAVAIEAKLTKVATKKLTHIVASRASSSHKAFESPGAGGPSVVAARLINDFKMNAKVNCMKMLSSARAVSSARLSLFYRSLSLSISIQFYSLSPLFISPFLPFNLFSLPLSSLCLGGGASRSALG